MVVFWWLFMELFPFVRDRLASFGVVAFDVFRLCLTL